MILSGGRMPWDYFATFQFMKFKSVFNFKTKVTVWIYLKCHYISTNSIRR